MIDTTSFILTREDGSKLYIEIEPVSYENHGAVEFAGVYHLQASRYDDPITAYAEDNPGDTIDAGTFAHKENDLFEWVYDGDLLTDHEQHQLAAYIQNLANVNSGINNEITHQPFDTFYMQAFYRGGMNSFEVKSQEGRYTVAFDGKIIAELQYQEKWIQVRGDPLDEDVFVSVKQAIEAKLNQ